MSDAVLIAIACLLAGLAAGALIAFMVRRPSSPQKDPATELEMLELTARIAELSKDVDNERHMNAERLNGMKEVFSAAAADALQRNNKSFIDLAKETFEAHRTVAVADLSSREKAIEILIGPIKESLSHFSQSVQELEKTRVGAYEGIKEQVNSLIQSQNDLRSETASLVNALKTPRVRGRWGEIQLRRVAELAGMIDHCDFFEQQSVTTDDGRKRPDMIIRLPGEKMIVIDAKAPLDQYLLAMDASTEEARGTHLSQYAVQVRGHMTALNNKAYWDQFKPTPEFVFMFLPGESFYSAALQADPALIEGTASQRVIVATPTTLIALLKAVASGWRQERLTQDVEKIGALGKDLYERISTMGTHFVNLGASLRTAVEKYNDTVGAMETRVLVAARRFKEMPIAPTDKDIKPAIQIETSPRQLQSAELNAPIGKFVSKSQVDALDVEARD